MSVNKLFLYTCGLVLVILGFALKEGAAIVIGSIALVAGKAEN